MKKVLFPVLALVLAIGLAIPMAMPAAASTDIWQIGDFEPSGSTTQIRDEFDNSGWDGTDYYTYDVNESVMTQDPSTFPGSLYEMGVEATYGDVGVYEVTIEFDLDMWYQNVQLEYARMGAEDDTLTVDSGSPVDLLGPGEGVWAKHTVDLGILKPVPHSIVIACTGTQANSTHYIDALKLTGDSFTIDLSADPLEDVNPVMTDHTITADIDADVDGVEVNFEVIDGVSPNEGDTGSDDTEGGVATFTYTGDGGAGIDTIRVWVDENCNSTWDDGVDPTVEVTKYWVTLDDLTPPLEFNLVGEEHCVTATIDPAVSGVPVHFMVFGLNFRYGVIETVDGVATFCYTGWIPGKDKIIAWLEVNGRFGYQPWRGDIGLSVEKYYLDHRITGGGNITEGRGKTAPKITFGGNVGIAGGEGLVGQYEINFHNVSVPEVAKGNFHTTAITFLDFKWLIFCPQPDPPDDAFFNWAKFKADGRFNGVDGYSVDVEVADHGEGKDATDTIRIRLYSDTTENQGPGTLVYDSYASGDFPADWVCLTLEWRRHELDGGNIQIHRIEIPMP